MALIAAFAAALGVFYVYTAVALRWPGLGFGPRLAGPAAGRRRSRRADWLVQAGLDDVPLGEFTGVIIALFIGGTLFGFVLFGPVPAPFIGAFTGIIPIALYRHRRTVIRQKAAESWPRLIEEIRILTSSVGRSVPQALFEVGHAAPDELQPAFEAAQREWLLSTNFRRTLDILKDRLADPTVDATCETLLIAHELGGSDLDQRLAALAEDRRRDIHDRKDALAKQAGARFARWFVIIVPLGMAAAGLTIGNGKDAYMTPMGSFLIVVAIFLIAACWIAASIIMRLPDEERVFQ
jgi:tight adherence protein B